MKFKGRMPVLSDMGRDSSQPCWWASVIAQPPSRKKHRSSTEVHSVPHPHPLLG